MLKPVFALFGLLVAPSADHDFHLSRLTVNANTETRTVELTLHTFIDDLQVAISDNPRVTANGAVDPDSLRLTDPRELPGADSLVARLLRDDLTLASGGETLPLTYLGKEAADDPYGIYLYLETELPESRDFEISSDYLCALYRDQQNVVVWQRNGRQVGYSLLTHSTREAKFAR